MQLCLTGDPFSQERHCYYVKGKRVSFLVDCGYQRCYEGDEVPHLTNEQIRSCNYLFLTHSHENQSGALPYLLSNGFTGRVVMTTETARQLPFAVDDPIILEGLSLPCMEAMLPGGLHVIWGRSGHCSGSAWFRIREDEHAIFFSGDYYRHARIHMADQIVGLEADLAVLDCEYGTKEDKNSRVDQMNALIDAISDALADMRPVLLPVPRYGRGQSILSYIHERLPDTDIFGDRHFITEMGHLDAAAMWVKPEAQDMLTDIFVRAIPDDMVALGVYFVSDPQMDKPQTRKLAQRLQIYGGRVFLTGTVEPRTHASLLMHSGMAQHFRYGIHCTQDDMLGIASQNDFHQVIAYRSDFAPTKAVYDIT